MKQKKQKLYDEKISSQLKDLLIKWCGQNGFEEIKKEEITLETNLRNDLAFDSLDEVEFLMEIDKEFGVDIDPTRLEKVDTFQEWLELLTDYLE